MPARPLVVSLTVSLSLLLAGAAIVHGQASSHGASTREYRYLMGTSIEVEAYGGDEATRGARRSTRRSPRWPKSIA